MALADAVYFEATSGGTGTFFFGGFVTSFLTLTQAVSLGKLVDGQAVSYVATDDLSTPTEREWGHGTFHSGNNGSVARTTILGTVNNSGGFGSGAPLNFSSRPVVALTALAEDIGGALGWSQTVGSPGVTETTPINAPAGSGQAGPDILIFAGSGDSAGAPGNIHLVLPAKGQPTFDPAGTQVTGVLLFDAGSNPSESGIFSIAMPYETGANNGQNLQISAGDADHTYGGGISLFSGSTVNPGGVGGNIVLECGIGTGGGGGSINLTAGGDSSGGDGGSFAAIAGAGTAGGIVQFQSGVGNGSGGGTILFITGSDSSGGNGGDFVLQFGTGHRDGLFFPHLPTTNPGVAGAMWCDTTDSNRVKIS